MDDSDGIKEIQSFFSNVDCCPLCDVGTKSRVKYKSDGKEEVFENEDKHFQCQRNHGKFCIYGVIDGHNGSKCSNATRLMLIEKLLESLNDNSVDEEIIKTLKDAFEGVSQSFFTDTIGRELSFLTNIKEEIKNIGEDEVKRFVDLHKSIKQCEMDKFCGCTVAIALIVNDSLYIANVGNVRVLLCRQDEHDGGELITTQLSVDHTVATNAELERLVDLGIEDLESLQKQDSIVTTTRSIGDYKLQKEYKEIDVLAKASSQPIICEPSVHGGETIKDQVKFMFIMSSGFYQVFSQTYESKPSEVNMKVSELINSHLLKCKTIKGVAQEIVESVAARFEDKVKGQSISRDDMTLLIRLFNYPPLSSLPSPSNKSEQKSVEDVQSRLTKVRLSEQLPKLTIPKKDIKNKDEDSANSTGNNTPVTTTPVYQQPSFSQDVTPTHQNEFSSDTSENMSNGNPSFPILSTGSIPETGKEGPVTPYVDFSEFFQKVNERGGERVVFKDFYF